MQRVGGDDTAFEIEAFQGVERRLDLVFVLAGARGDGQAVCASHTLIISGGMNLPPRSYPRRKRLPSTATTPATGPRPSASRNAA